MSAAIKIQEKSDNRAIFVILLCFCEIHDKGSVAPELYLRVTMLVINLGIHLRFTNCRAERIFFLRVLDIRRMPGGWYFTNENVHYSFYM